MNTATNDLESKRDPPPDLDLWHRWTRGDAGAGRQLSRRLLPALRSFFASKVLATDVDDLIQQVWLELGETIRRRAPPELTSSVRAYLLGIARHVLFRHLSRRTRDDRLDPVTSSLAVLEPSLSQVVGRQLQAQRMLHALHRLPLDIQVILELRYVQDLTTPEIAALYGIPDGTVKSRLARARRLLDEELRRDEG